MLATAEGLEAIAAEERYRRTSWQEIEYRTAAIDFARSLQNEPTIIDPMVASFVLDTVEEITKGTNPERSGTVASGTLKNVAITAATAATLGAFCAAAAAYGSAAVIVSAGATVLVVGEALKDIRNRLLRWLLWWLRDLITFPRLKARRPEEELSARV